MLHLSFKSFNRAYVPYVSLGFCSSSWPASAPFIGPLAFGPALASAEPRPGYCFGGREEARTVPLLTPQAECTIPALAQDTGPDGLKITQDSEVLGTG